MRPVTYSWIAVSAVSPLAFLGCAWALGVLHSYRRFWRSLDLFLAAVFAQELLAALQSFAYALLSLARPHAHALCGVFVWGLSATRALQGATMASLLADRALTAHWPYRYRFSVRRHQVRYHLVVLAAMASLVGVAALLARPPAPPSGDESFEECRFLPHSLHVRLALFLLALHGLLLAVASVSVGVVQATRGCRRSVPRPVSGSQDLAPITHGTTGSSTTSASSGTGGARPLHPVASSASTSSSTSSGDREGSSGLQSASSTADLVTPPLRHPPRRGAHPPARTGPLRTTTTDFRWGGSLAVAGVCLVVNHLPYIGLLVVGTFFSDVLPEWPMENLSLWLSLLQGLLLPLALGLSDPTFAEAALLSCSRESPPTRQTASEGVVGSVFRAGAREEAAKAFPLTNGSLFPSLLSMNIHAPLYGRPKGPPTGLMRMAVTPSEALDGQGLTPPAPPDSCLRGPFVHHRLFFNPDGSAPGPDPIYADPLAKTASPEGSLGLSDEDPIYATLSEALGSLSSASDEYPSLGGEGLRCSSATTAADDDFEFHGPSREVLPPPFVGTCNLAMTSGDPPQGGRYASSSPSSSFRSVSSDTTGVESSPRFDPGGINPRASPRLGFTNAAFEGDTLERGIHPYGKESLQQLDVATPLCSDPTEGNGTLSRRHRSSSLSMNDLDRLGPYGGAPPRESGEEEMMFILPVRSESMLSLYRLYLAEEDAPGHGTSLHYSLEASKSEGDLTALPAGVRSPGGGPVQEIYQKKRVPAGGGVGSRVRRQHKIQRAKYLQARSRPVLATHAENPFPQGKLPSAEEDEDEEGDSYWGQKRDRDPSHPQRGVQLAVLNRAQRQNGIITIRDPAGLSVEELFMVLNRASSSGGGGPGGKTQDSHGDRLHVGALTSYPTTEYKKIFVSEYI